MPLIKNIKRLFIGLILVILLPLCLVACNNYEDLSSKQPYVESIGKHFITQKDLYVYEFNNPTASLRIGPGNEMGNYSIGIPKLIDEKYIGIKG